MNILIAIQSIMDRLHHCALFSALASLGLRLYLAPVFWVAGTNKIESFPDIVQWFGNPDWGLGLPFPTLMATLATGAEVLGAIALILGLGVRWATIPLMFTMIVAATSVHWHNGWQAVHDMMSPWANEHAAGAIERLDKAKELLQTHGNYEWLTEHGNFIVSNNGVEWAVTYFVMLLALFFLGGGRYISADYWIRRQFMPNTPSK